MAAYLWNGIRVYADQADLTEWANSDQSGVSDARLASASVAVDNACRGSLYLVDSGDGFPTDAKIIAALKWATCAVVSWRVEAGDPSGNGAAELYQTASLGSASYTKAQPGAGSPRGRDLPSDARAILRGAGLLSTAVYSYG
jgi:hypothetical protein